MVRMIDAMKSRFLEQKVKTMKPRDQHALNRTWEPNNLCEVTRNLLDVVNGLTLTASMGHRLAMVNQLPALLLNNIRSSSDIHVILRKAIFLTFLDLLDFPGVNPLSRADVCPAPRRTAKVRDNFFVAINP